VLFEPGRERIRFPNPELETARERKPVDVEDWVGGGMSVISVEVVQSVSVSPDHDVGPGILTKYIFGCCSSLKFGSCTLFKRKSKLGDRADFKYK